MKKIERDIGVSKFGPCMKFIKKKNPSDKFLINVTILGGPRRKHQRNQCRFGDFVEHNDDLMTILCDFWQKKITALKPPWF